MSLCCCSDDLIAVEIEAKLSCDLLNLKIWQIHVTVTREFLESVEENVRSRRPAWRVDAAKVDTHCDSVLLLSDHSIFPRGNYDLLKLKTKKRRIITILLSDYSPPPALESLVKCPYLSRFKVW